MILIVGASGFIGNYFFKSFNKDCIKTLGTAYKNKGEDLIYFDVKNMRLSDLELKEKPSHIIFSSATTTKIDDTRKFWEESYFANCKKIKEGIEFCFKNNITPVFVSTDHVFDGEKGDYKEEDERNPINCYGQIKYEVENYLIESGKPYLIVRVGKVFGLDVNDETLFSSFIKKMQRNETLNCVSNQIFTPIYIGEMYNFMKILITKNYNGVFHLASCPTTTFYEVANKIKEYYNFDSEINSCTWDSFGLLEKRPVLINLNINKIKEITGFNEKPIEFFLEKIKI
ncbi:MAG: sugar nucleotide-binding protein [archaeon]